MNDRRSQLASARKACFLSVLAQAAVWLRELRVSQHFSTFYGSSVQSMDTQLDARHRRRTPTIHRGTAQRTISADATNPVGKKIRVNNFAACQCGARPGRTARMMRYSRSRPVLTLSPGLSQLACKQMRFVAGMNRERLGAVRELRASAYRGWLLPTRLTAQAE